MQVDIIEDIYPLTPMQQGMLFHTLYAPESEAYFEQLACRLHGSLDAAAFRQAWQRLVDRHPVLRTAFELEESEQPVQVVFRQLALPLAELDWRPLAAAAQREGLAAFLEGDRRRGFVPAEAPLLRLTLIRLAEEEHVFVWSHHHILLDGWCLSLLFKEVFAFYEAFRQGRDVVLGTPRPFRDYVAWLLQRDPQRAEAYWRRELRGLAAPTAIPVVAPAAETAAGGRPGESLEVRLEAAATARLESLARLAQVTPSTVVQSAWGLLLGRYSGETEVLFGVTVSGRPPELRGAEAMVGLFINTLPLRVAVPEEERLTAWLQRLQSRQAEMRDFEHTSLTEIKAWSEMPPGVPLFESLLVFENYPVDRALREQGTALGVDDVSMVERTNYPLTLIAAPGREMRLQLAFDGGRVERVAAQRMLRHCAGLLRAFTLLPEGRLEDLPLLDEAERWQLLGEWNDGAVPRPENVCLHDLVAAQAAQTPEAPAVVFEGTAITYAELDRRAGRLASRLRALGVGPDVAVAVLLERSIELVVALLGILKAGGGYLPLDPDDPAERLAWIAAEAGVPVLLSRRRFLAAVSPPPAAAVVLLEEGWDGAGDESAAAPVSPADGCLAYVIYTSGSTGRPKGVMNTHRGIVNRLLWMQEAYGLTAADRVLQKTPFTFDVSVWELFWPLLVGARLVMARPGGHRDTAYLARTIATEGITTVHFVTSVLAVFLEEPEAARCTSLRRTICSGEALTPEHVKRAAVRLSGELHNLYGPTEAAVDVTAWACPREAAAELRAVPIGRPVANTEIHLLDRRFRPVPVGVPGELFIGGVQLARGYWNRPDLTAERFVPNPLGSAGERLYRTGDLSRRLPDGTIEFLGRLDFQVKVRGLRIELGEIEAALTAHPEVREAVVVVRGDGAGDRRLVAYVAPRSEPAPAAADLLSFVASRLPAYMVPAAWVLLPELPLTSSGKVDRKALPDPQWAGASGRLAAAPRTPTEEILAGLWAGVLGLDEVGVDDDFFALGGHSLLAMQVASRLRWTFQVDLPLRRLFEAPTVARLALEIERELRSGAVPEPARIEILPRDGELPLSFAQQRLWFLDQLDPGSPLYNLAMPVRLTGRLQAAALEGALAEVARRHESLRTTFADVEGRPFQRIAPPRPRPLPVVDLAGVPAAAGEMARLARAESRQPFDLAAGPLWRASLVRLEDEDHLLLLTMHHIVSDGWSVGVLVRELLELYAAAAAGRPPLLPEPVVQYADFAGWQRRWLEAGELERQLAYWRARLAGPPVLELPLDRPRPPVQSFRGGRHLERLGAPLPELCQGLGRREGATLFMTLLAAAQALLGRLTGQEDLLVGTPVAGRNRPETEGVIGLFVNTLVLRGDLAGDPSFRDLLARVRETALGAFAHSDVPFERLVDELQPERDLSRSPLFQVMFGLQNAPLPELAAEGLRLDPVEVQSGTRKFDLDLNVEPAAESLVFRLGYSRDLFDGATARRMLAQFCRLLAAALEDPELPVSELPLLSAAESAQVLREWNDSRADYPRDHCVHELFERQVDRAPERIAVVCGGETLTYGELERRANRLAHRLRRLGVGPDVPVALYLERSLDLAVALVGVLKAGGAYVPLDLDYPAERVAYMLEESRAAVLLTVERLLADVPPHTAHALCMDGGGGESAERPARSARPDNLLYVMFTSGSTGRPKGVMEHHRGLVNRLVWAERDYPLTCEDRVLQQAPLSFDPSVWEIFGPLLAGGRTVFARPGEHREVDALVETIRAEGVTIAHFLPTILAPLLEEGRLDSCPSLRYVLTGGEVVSPELVRLFRDRMEAAAIPAVLHNQYGPTEVAINATVWISRPGDPVPRSVPIGRVLANQAAYILDHRLRPVPAGVAGELFLGGDGVARGYFRRPGLTAERFLPDPFSPVPGARLYRTGDVARRLPSGELAYLGRIDNQVKVRGVRIELGEVEAALGSHPGVREAVVAAQEIAGGGKRLIGYVVPVEGAGLAAAELREHLQQRLPDPMVPTAWVLLAELPITPNGKVDRRALPEPAAERQPAGERTAPRGAVEEALAAIWCEVLRLDAVGVDDNFFELGGDSILSIQVVSRARRGGLHLSARQVFENQTVAELARVVAAPPAGAAADEALGPVPLTPIQARFFAAGLVSPHHWNQALLLAVPRLDPAALQRALTVLLTHHDALRTRFTPRGDGWSQEIPPAGAEAPFGVIDLAALPEDVRSGALEGAAADLQASLHLSRGPLVRFASFALGGGADRLLLIAHHLVVDGVSWRVLLDDLERLYGALTAGRPADPGPPTTSFRRWALLLEEHARSPGLRAEAEHWLALERSFGTGLPVDHELGPNSVASAHAVVVELDEEETRQLLQEVPRAFRARVDDALLAALGEALAPWTGTAGVLVDLEGHGREEIVDGVDLSRTVGWLTTVFPVLLEPAGSSGASLRRIKERLHGAPSRGLGHGLLLYLGGDAEMTARLRTLPRPQVAFNYLGRLDRAVGAGSLFRPASESAGPSRDPRGARHHLLEIDGAITGGRLRLSWTYSANAHRRETVEAAAGVFLASLRRILAGTAAAGSAAFTAADFPLARLDGESLARILEPRAEVEDLYPLSPMQQGILFHCLFDPASSVYRSRMECTLRGPLDEDAFERAWREVVDRHPVLRTAFLWEDLETPLQVVQRQVSLPLRQEDWRGLPEDVARRRLAALAEEERGTGFDLGQAPLMRLRLVRLGDEEWHLAWDHHHLLIDGWSLSIVLNEIFTLYEAFRHGSAAPLERPRPFRDYVAWLQAQDAAAAEAFWRRQLAGLTVPPPLGLPRPAAGEGDHFGELELRLPAEAGAALHRLARQCRVTLGTVLQSAWALLLSRYDDGGEAVFGAVVAGRPPEVEGFESIVGLFINTLPLRVAVAEGDELAGWLRRLQEQQAALRHYEWAPLAQIQRWSGVPQGEPLFHSLFAFESYPVDVELAERSASLRVEDLRFTEQTSYPLALSVFPGPELRLQLVHDVRQIDDGMAARLLGHLRTLLLGYPADPAQTLGALPLLSADEVAQVLVEWSAAEPLPEPLPATVHELFAAAARRRPEAPAVISDGATLSYGELDARADRLARRLRAAGVGPEALVGIRLERSPELAVALLAVLKAGGACLPLDPSFPAERLDLLISDAGLRWVLDGVDGAGLPAGDGLDVSGLPDHLAYVIYTSGSTGRPKGVLTTHGALVAYAVDMVARFGLGPSDRILQFAPLSFDVLLEELLPTWAAGGAVVFADPDELAYGEGLQRVLEAHEVTGLELPASYWHEWVRGLAAAGGAPPASLRFALVGCDRPAPERVAQWLGFGLPLIHVFGLTETAITTTLHRVDPGSDDPSICDVPIGRPVAGSRVYVLGAGLRPVPAGVAAELFIGGPGLARGYLGQPALTAERFIPSPFGEAGGRLYRTGDRARFRPDGSLDFLGRMDHQVKVRGFRIEPGEVEAALCRHPAVGGAVVLAREDRPGDRRLVAYLTPGDEFQSPQGPLALRDVLLQRRQVEIWPSHGEYPVYDELLYSAMTHDRVRNELYRRAIARVVPGKVVVDAGAGGDVSLSRFCVEAGARRVYAVEALEPSYRAAQATVERLGLQDRIVVLHGEITEIELPEKADVCVSELIGSIGGSEGAALLLDSVRRRLLRAGGAVVPERCVTRVAAVRLPADVRERPVFGRTAAHYAARIFSAVGARFDVRLCLRGLPSSHVVSESGVFEDLDFRDSAVAEPVLPLRLHIRESSRIDGFLLWIELFPGEGEPLDSLRHDCSFLPVFLPVFSPELEVSEGDLIEASCGSRPCEDGIHPDYWIAGCVRHRDGRTSDFAHTSPHHADTGGRTEFYRLLFASLDAGVVAAEREEVTARDLREHLAGVLPEHMVPALFVALDRLPLSPNGKVDRQALPAPDLTRSEPLEGFAGPRDEIERTLARIWGEVLGAGRVGIHDNFFALGGDSILSLQIISRARQADLHLSPRQIFEHPTIAGLAPRIAPAAAASRPVEEVVGDVPLTPIQRWFFAQDLADPHHFNMALLLETRERLQDGPLEAAVAALVRRHDALRLRFARQDGIDGTWTQACLAPAGAAPFTRIDLSALPPAGRRAALPRALDDLQGSLDLAAGPLLRAVLFDRGGDPGDPEDGDRLLLLAHHLVVDGVSWRVLVEDLETAYRQGALASPAISFGAWARRLAREVEAGAFQDELSLWLAAAEAAAPPLSAAPAGNTVGSASTLRLALGVEETSALLREVPQAYRTRINDVLLAALGLAFYRWSGDRRLLVELEGHGREEVFPDVDLSRTVGWFTALFPVLLDAGDPSEGPGTLLKRTKERLRRVPRGGLGFGALRLASGDPEIRARLAALPRPQVLFNYLGQVEQGRPSSPLFSLAAEPAGRGHSPRALRGHRFEINCRVDGGRLEVDWTWSRACQDRAAVESLAGGYLDALRELVAHCLSPEARGTTPSDFPLARLDQAWLDELAATAPPIDEAYPLSPMQQGMLFHSLFDPAAGMYVAQFPCELRGELDLDVFRRSWESLAARHEVLRSAFLQEGLAEPLQVVFAEVTLPWVELDWRDLPAAEQEERFAAWLREDRLRGFRTSEAPLTRLTLIRTAADTYRLVWSLHQMVADGWSLPLLFRDLLALYEALHAGRQPRLEPVRPYRDYIAWLQRQSLAGAEAWWRNALAGFTMPTPLPGGGQAGPEAGRSYGERQARLSVELTAALQALAREGQVTPNSLFQGAWGLLLSRWSGADDVVFGVVVSGRPAELAGVESMVGLFINCLPLRLRTGDDEPVLRWLQEVQERQSGLLQLQHSPLAQVQGWSGIERGRPLFESILVFQNYPLDRALAKRSPGALDIRLTGSIEQTNYPLTLVVFPGPQLTLNLKYDRDRFDAATVERLLGHLERLLGGMVEDPQRRLSELSLLSAAERRQLLEERSPAGESFPVEAPLHRLFEGRAALRPQAPAVVCAGRSLTYGDLDARANRLARHLLGLGVVPGSRVVLCLERDLELVVAILAVLKAGCAYVPLDGTLPTERLAFLLADSGVQAVITQETTQESLLGALPEPSVPVLCLEREGAAIDGHSADDLGLDVIPEQAAYVIYTSGSTGRPKGVVVSHANAVRLFTATHAWFGFGPEDVWTLFHSYAFDFSVWEIWGALLYGGRLVVVPYWVSRSPESFLELLARERVTVLSQTPSAFRQLLRVEEAAALADTPAELSLRWVVFGGEALELGSLRSWYERHAEDRPRLVNLYGITETTVHVTYRELRAADAVSGTGSRLGSAIPDLQVLVLDSRQGLVPEGVAGELCVGGAGLAWGYLGRPELTAERFVPHPFAVRPGERLYRSGDLGRWVGGDLEYLGRIDHQVKVRGFRIELGEIEAVLGRHEAVRETVVVARSGEPGEARLVAYVVFAPGESATAVELRDFAGRSLPEPMVPAAFVALESLPLTGNGKVDRRALPAPEEDGARLAVGEAWVAPKTREERVLAEVWARVLGVERVGVHDNFFALGGDSILSLRIMSQAREQGLEVTLQDLFEHQTIARLTAALAQGEGAAETAPGLPAAPFELVPEQDRALLPSGLVDAYPVSRLQAGMLFHSSFQPESVVYHNVWSVRITAPFDEAALREAVRRLVARHPVLRTSFDLVACSEPLQLVHAAAEAPVAVDDLRGLPEKEQRARIESWLAAEQRRPFDWTRPPLVRFQVHRLSDETFHFGLTEHHAILDGWSVASLTTELFLSFTRLRQGEDDGLAAPVSTFREAVAMERAALGSEEHRGFWERRLAGAALAALPRWPAAEEREPPSRVEVPVSPQVSDRLKRLATEEAVPVKSVLLAAHLRVIQVLTGQSDLVTGLVSNGRAEGEDGERVLGLFLNTLPLRLDLPGGTWRELIRGAFAAEREMLPFRRYPLAELQKARGGGAPLFETAFNFTHFHVFAALDEVGDVRAEESRELAETEIPLIADFNLEVGTQRIRLGLTPGIGQLPAGQVAAIAGLYAVALEALAADPGGRYELCSLLGEGEQRQMEEWNRTAVDYPAESTVPELFADWAARTPEAVAVVCGRETLTYAELDREANRLARHLRSLGVAPGALVGLYMDRCPAMVVGLLGILKAGAAYVALDPAYPPARLAFLLEDTGVPVVLSLSAMAGALPPHRARVVCLDGEAEAIERWSGADPGVELTPEHLAYVSYTSGSTGRPKGVEVRHRGVLRLLCGIDYADFSGGRTLLQLSPIAFDASTVEIWGALLHGGRCVLLPQRVPTVAELGRVVRETGVDVLPLTTSLYNAVIDEAPEVLAGVAQLLVGGEALSVHHVRKGLDLLPAVRFVACYGPTESTTFTCCYQVPRDLDPAARSILLGRPIGNTRVYLLDRHLQPVPPGTMGELYIGGAGLARGYLKRPELTAEKFLPDPFGGAPGERLYRTGDLARFLPGGLIEFGGRLDDQVKIRGFRIEPGEIEAALLRHQEIKEAAVLVREDVPGSKRLVAYLVPEAGARLDVPEVRGFLAAHLPEHMVPAALQVLAALPLTPSGKVDRHALPAPERAAAVERAGRVAPRSAAERALARIWERLLGIEGIGVHDNFLELGGDSILSIQVVARASQEGLRLTPQQLFLHPTLAELAAVAGVAPEVSAEQGLVVGEVPLTPVQAWFLERVQAAPHHWNQSLLLRSRQPLEPGALARSIDRLLAHHDALRLRFARGAQGWTQRVAGLGGPPAFACVDLAALPAALRPAAVTAAAAAAQASLDLAGGPLLRALLFDLGPGTESRLLLAIHHLAVDGVSWRVLLEDLQTAYGQATRGAAIVLPAKTTSFREWAERLAGHARSEAVRGELAGWLGQPWAELAPLPVDHPGGASTEGSARQVSTSLSPEETRALLQDVPGAYRTRINDVLLTALVRAFAAWTGNATLLIDLEGHGRDAFAEGLDVARTVGWFTAIYPVLLQTTGPDPGGDLKATKEALRRVPGQGLGYGLLRFLAGDPEVEKRLLSLPRAEVLFNYLGQLDQVLPEESPFQPAPEPAGPPCDPRERRGHLLEINSLVAAGRLQVAWTYGAGLHERSSIEALAQGFLAELRGLIAHCLAPQAGGCTPSDFPLAALGQADLDRLVREPRRVEDVYPLSPTQQGILFHSLFAPEEGSYLAQVSCLLEGDLDVVALARAWQRLIDRHPVLRTAFAWDDPERLLQIVYRGVALPFAQEDWSGLPPDRQAERFAEVLVADRRQGFDLARPPLMRVRLFRLGAAAHRLVWCAHHLLLDGWSLSIIFQELFAFYASFRRGGEPQAEERPPYRDYISWLRGRDAAATERFWRRELRGFTAPLRLPATAGGAAPGAGRGERRLLLSAGRTAELDLFARSHQITLNTVFQGVWGLLLSHLAGGEDVVFGATVAGRPPELRGMESMVGLFINTLPLRITIDARAEALGWLRALQVRNAALREHEHTPLASIARWSDVPLGRPLFESILVFESYPVGEGVGRGGDTGITLRDVRFHATTNYPLAVRVTPGPELLIEVLYDAGLIDAAVAERLPELIDALLGAMIREPRTVLGKLSSELERSEREARARKGMELKGANARRLRELRRA